MNESSNSWVEDWLSAERFATYVTIARGDRGRALALHEWNSRLSASFLHDLSHLEVGLRNAYDRALTQATRAGDDHWTNPATMHRLFPPPSPRVASRKPSADPNRKPRQQVERAVLELQKRFGWNVASGRVVAEIMFGFWTYLTSDAHEKTLWVPYLYKAFPRGTDRSRVRDNLSALRDFRNRVAHHEPIFSEAENHRRRIVTIVRLLSPDAYLHLKASSDTSAVLAAKP